MIKTILNGLPVFQFRNLIPDREIIHFSTIREGGVSSGTYHSLNLGMNSGDTLEAVLENRCILRRSLEIADLNLVLPRQTHSANIKVIHPAFQNLTEKNRKEFLLDTDALITSIRGIAIMVKTADCVPILLFDRKRKVIAAVHAGWRGTQKGIVSLTISRMKEEFGTDPSDILSGIGPSISPVVYQVGPEVWEQFIPDFYSEDRDHLDKRYLDLWKANRLQLRQAGVRDGNIESAELCTYSNPDLFFSARRDGVKTGRMATGIMLKK